MTSSKFINAKSAAWLRAIFLAAIVVSLGWHFGTPTADAATTGVLASSNSSSNVAVYYSLKNYGLVRSSVDWPQRSQGCNGSGDKMMPWLPDTLTGVKLGSGDSPQNYDGNTFTRSGNCSDRYVDGGNPLGAWMKTSALGGWANGGSSAGFGPVYPGSTGITSCDTLPGGSARMIWGRSGYDSSDQAYGAGGLMSQMPGYPTTMPTTGANAGVGLFSNGTTLFRNTFTLTQAEYDAINNGTMTVKFYATADDWLAFYLNGVMRFESNASGGAQTNNIAGGFKVGTNVIAIQGADKAYWRQQLPGQVGSGVCYNLTASDSSGTLPPSGGGSGGGSGGTDSPPTGTISVSCTDPAAGTQTANFSFSDPNGQARAYVQVEGGKRSNDYTTSPATFQFPSDRQNFTPVDLMVYNVRPDGTYDPSPTKVASDLTNRNGPCQPPENVGCSISIKPDEIDPGMPFQATVTASSSQRVPPPTISITLSNSSGVVATKNNPKPKYSGGDYVATFGFRPVGGSGAYLLSAVFQANGANSQPCSKNFTVGNEPYLSIFGSDAVAGAYAAGGSGSCTINNNAGFWSWNFDGTNGSYMGAGAEYAVMALGSITHFASSLGSTGSNPKTPVGESFANTGNNVVDVPNAVYGGNFGASATGCKYIDPSMTPDTSGDKIISGQSVTANDDVVYVKGHDVYISGNIVYSNNARTDLSDIPSFKLIVVGGDVYIGKNVSELDGLYVAEPDNGVGGTIYTCANGIRSAVDTGSANYFNDCNQQLKIYGSFAAKQVRFLRTYGTLSQANGDSVSGRSSHAAELFIYTPELWLAGGSSADVNKPLSITGLPPVL